MRVLLIHGLSRTPLSLVGLARDLRRAGYRTELVAYAGAVETFPRIVARVRRRLEAAAQGGGPYAVVAHSLGGLIVRAALERWPATQPLPRQLIMLGTPSQAPRVARRFHRWWPYRLVNGQSGQLLADPDFFARLPRPAVPITVIAGTKAWPAPLSLLGGTPNDGLVAVDEARLESEATLIEVRASHTFMMNNRQVRAAVREVLDRSAAASRRLSMAEINDCVPGRQARVLQAGVARVIGRTGTIVEVSRVRRPASGPLKDRVTVDVPGHGEISLSPGDIEVVPE